MEGRVTIIVLLEQDKYREKKENPRKWKHWDIVEARNAQKVNNTQSYYLRNHLKDLYLNVEYTFGELFKIPDNKETL